MSRLYVGIDVHRLEHRVAIASLKQLESATFSWQKIKLITIGNNRKDYLRLLEAIKKKCATPADVAFAIDHTGSYSAPLTHFLRESGYTPRFLEAKAVKAARQRLLDEENKRDEVDARGSAYLLYLQEKHGLSFRIPDSAQEINETASALSILLLERERLLKSKTQLTNRLHQLLVVTFPEGERAHFRYLLKFVHLYPTPREILESPSLVGVSLPNTRRRQIIKLAGETIGINSAVYSRLIKQCAEQILLYNGNIENNDREIKELLPQHPYSRILFSFPGIGEVVAATLIAVIKDVNRYPTDRKLKKALGVSVKMTQSAGSWRSEMGHEGSRTARKALFMACLGTLRNEDIESDFRDYYQRQVKNGKNGKKALVSTMGKLAEIVYHCLKNDELYGYQGIYR